MRTRRLLNEPARVNCTSPVEPFLVSKKPSPLIARSSALPVCSIGPWVKFWLIESTRVPRPTVIFGSVSAVPICAGTSFVANRASESGGGALYVDGQSRLNLTDDQFRFNRAESYDKPVPDTELADAKRTIVAVFALSLETPDQMIGYYVQNWLYGLPADYWDTYPAKINAVTAAQAQAAGSLMVTPSSSSNRALALKASSRVMA